MIGPCAKQTVTATIVALDGHMFVGTNHCNNPQAVCPRSDLPSGVGYEMCRDICDQPAHAEVNAIMAAGEKAKGATIYLEGHTYFCCDCKKKIEQSGIKERYIIGAPA